MLRLKEQIKSNSCFTTLRIIDYRSIVAQFLSVCYRQKKQFRSSLNCWIFIKLPKITMFVITLSIFIKKKRATSIISVILFIAHGIVYKEAKFFTFNVIVERKIKRGVTFQ